MRGVCVVVLFALAIIGCGEADKDQLLVDYLRNNLGYGDQAELPKAIFVLTEEGCPACDRAFADALRPFADSPNCLFLVRAEGRTINMSGFLDQTDRIRYDDGAFKELNLLTASGVILLHDSAIDTVINLNATEIRVQIALVNGLLRDLSTKHSSD
jgi:hypothetical protein